MNPSIVLTAFYQGTEWTCAETYDTLDWHSSTPKPTEKELLSKYDDALAFHAMDTIRNERNGLLATCDWTQLSDAQVDAKAWAKYRQALRDLPANTEDPRNPVWPSKP